MNSVGTDTDDTSNLDIPVGRAVRRYRKKNGLTLVELSQMSGISSAMISRIENGQSTASLSSLNQLAKAMSIPIISLFEHTLNSTDINVVRGDQGLNTVRMSPGDTHTYSILGQHSDEDLNFSAAFVTLHKGENINLPIYRGEGYIFIRIQEGRAMYRCGDNLFELGEGDSISFDARITNGFDDLLSERVSFISVVAKKLWG